MFVYQVLPWLLLALTCSGAQSTQNAVNVQCLTYCNPPFVLQNGLCVLPNATQCVHGQGYVYGPSTNVIVNVFPPGTVYGPQGNPMNPNQPGLPYFPGQTYPNQPGHANPCPNQPIAPYPPVQPNPNQPGQVNPCPNQPVSPYPPVQPSPNQPGQVNPCPNQPVSPYPPVQPNPNQPGQVNPCPNQPMSPYPPVQPNPNQPGHVNPCPNQPVSPYPPVQPSPNQPGQIIPMQPDPCPNSPVSPFPPVEPKPNQPNSPDTNTPSELQPTPNPNEDSQPKPSPNDSNETTDGPGYTPAEPPTNLPPTTTARAELDDETTIPDYRIPEEPELTTPAPTTTTPVPITTAPPPAPIIRCPPGTVLLNGSCRLVYCGSGMNVNGRCVQPRCPAGTVWAGQRCAPFQPVELAPIHLERTIIMQKSHKVPDVVLNNVDNLVINASIVIPTREDDYEYEDYSDEDDTTPSATTTTRKCCIVIAPRICRCQNEVWRCYNQRQQQCGSFCSAAKVQLKPSSVSSWYDNDDEMLLMPPNSNFDCLKHGNCTTATEKHDCSGCASGVMTSCSSYCYNYRCNGANCAFYDQQLFCESVQIGTIGCRPEDGWLR